MEIWSKIIETNAFNFIILLLIIFAILKICKVKELIEKAQNEVKTIIDKSSVTKENSIVELNKTKENVKNVDCEIKEIFEKNEKNIQNAFSKIEEQTVVQVGSIKENAQKLVQREEIKAFSNLSKETALSCFELAKKHIIQVLDKKPQYHQKFIKESIEELSGLEYNEK